MNKNILLVEYDESTISIIKELFSLTEIEITVVSDGESALRLLGKKPFDLIITAAMLPRFHGFKLCQDVVTQYPAIPVIIISAIYKGLQYRHMAVTQYKAADFFEKPLEKERFKHRILELLNIREKETPQPSVSRKQAASSSETVKLPPQWDEKEKVKKVSSEDIFGDIIEQVERVPEIEIRLDEKPMQAAPHFEKKMPIPEKPSIPKKEVPVAEKPKVKEPYVKHEIPVKKLEAPTARDIGVPVPDVQIPAIKDEVVELRVEDSVSEKPKPAVPVIPQVKPEARPAPLPREFKVPPPPKATKPAPKFLEPAAAALSDLELKVKTQKIAIPQVLKEKKADTIPINLDELLKRKELTPSAARLKKIEDDIMKKLDETLSGLGFPGAAKAPLKEDKAFQIKKEEVSAEKRVEEEWDYDILGLIARGGMAEIYKARKRGHKGFEKIIAIKKILSGYGEDDKYIEMLIDEAKVAAQLSHPNIVHIYDLKKKDNFYFIVMEYVLGKDLRVIQRILQEKNRLVPEDRAIFIMTKVLEALNYAHKATGSEGKTLEIVHRDVSPPNILISYNGDVKLADFGISKASIKIHQTVSGALKGKLLYMSPEQAQGEENIDYRSDLYSVGLILYELLTGKKQFMDRTEMGILKKVQQGHIMSVREANPGVDAELDAIVVKCLNKEKDKRYQSAAEMITDLQSYLLRKYHYFPGPIHLAQFMTELFQEDIRKEGIKVEIKPTFERPAPKKVEKAEEPKVVALPPPRPQPPIQAAPVQPIPSTPATKPQVQPLPPPQPISVKPPPPPPLEEKTTPERKIVEINLDEDLPTPEKSADTQDEDIIITISSPTSSGLDGGTGKPGDDKKPEKPKKGWFS